jgi:hypothetical protein
MTCHLHVVSCQTFRHRQVGTEGFEFECSHHPPRLEDGILWWYRYGICPHNRLTLDLAGPVKVVAAVVVVVVVVLRVRAVF